MWKDGQYGCVRCGGDLTVTQSPYCLPCRERFAVKHRDWAFEFRNPPLFWLDPQFFRSYPICVSADTCKHLHPCFDLEGTRAER